MIAVSVGLGVLRLIVFNSEREILSATIIGIKTDIHSFSGGYFFLNNDDNAVVIGNNKLACYPTAHVRQKDEVYSLDPIWKSDDLVKLIIGHKHVIDDAENVLYVAMGYSI